jgi:hypothetical protein
VGSRRVLEAEPSSRVLLVAALRLNVVIYAATVRDLRCTPAGFIRDTQPFAAL